MPRSPYIAPRGRRAPFTILALACLLLGSVAGRAQFRPAILVEELVVADPPALAAAVARANVLMRAHHDVPLFLRAYAATGVAGGSAAAFSLSPAASFEALLKNTRAFAAHQALADVRRQLIAATKPGTGTYLKAVRFDGTNTPGWLLNTRVKTDDEAALLARVSDWAAQLAATGPAAATPRVNVFRVVAGHSGYTHLVSLNTADSAELGARLDALAAGPLSLTFSLSSGARCEIIDSAVYRELEP